MKNLHTREVLLQRPTEDGLYVLPSNAEAESVDSQSLKPRALLGKRNSTKLWHYRLRHPNSCVIAFAFKQFNLPVFVVKTDSLCLACLQAKAHTLPHPLSHSRSHSRSQFPFQLLFLDVWGPTHVLSSKGYQLYISIVDNFSKYTLFFSLYVKSDVVAILKFFLHFFVM